MNTDSNSFGLVYRDREIHARGEMLSLTDMWRAAGSPDDLKPAEWRRYPRTEKRAAYISTTMGLSHSQCFQALNESGDWNTWAHWALAIEYAEDLSVDMWFWAKTAIREKMESRGVPVQSTAAVVAQPSRLEQTLDKLADLVYNGMTRHSAEIAEVKTEVSACKTGLARVESRLDAIASRGRRKIKDTTKGEIVRQTDQLGGRCPCCGVATVTDSGYKLAHAEFDHFYANSAPDADHVWLICIGCHGELTRHVSKRDERNAEFQAFQAKRRRLPGVQLRLIGDAA